MSLIAFGALFTPCVRAVRVRAQSMSSLSSNEYITSIHSSSGRAVLYCAGGGSTAIGALLAVPGSSSTVLEACAPYSRGALRDVLGENPPDSLASQECAELLAKAALKRAATLTGHPARFNGDDVHLVGVAAACALSTHPPRRGQDRAHIVAADASGIRSYNVSFAPDASNDSTTERSRQEKAVSAIILRALASVCGVRDDLDIRSALQPADDLSETKSVASDPVNDVLSGKLTHAHCSGGSGAILGNTCGARVLLPGSFNPLHVGHRRLLNAGIARVRAQCGENVTGAFELSIRNPDKPSLELGTVRKRIAQFDTAESVIISSASLFTVKAKLYPGTTFVVGHDTAVRLVDAKYYGGHSEMLQALVGFAQRGCTFLVAARVDGDGVLRTLSDVNIPAALKNLFEEIPANEFREDVSSTALRAQATGRKL